MLLIIENNFVIGNLVIDNFARRLSITKFATENFVIESCYVKSYYRKLN